MAFTGLLKEAEASDNAALAKVLKDYDDILAENNTNIVSILSPKWSVGLRQKLTYKQPITKRRIALLRSLGRTSEAVSGLTALLDFCPVDAESWAELADIYTSQGMYAQAIYSLEEVLVLSPNAWNVSHRNANLWKGRRMERIHH